MLRALLFDVYGTLLDAYGLAGALNEVAPGRGGELSVLWRRKQIDYTRLRTLSDRYVPFDKITADGLDAAAEALGIRLSETQRRALLAAYDVLPAHPEAKRALHELAGEGLALGVLSNGTPAMIESAVASAGLGEFLAVRLSVDSVKAYKTANAAYQLGPDALGLPAGEIGFVSSNAWDAAGAVWFGYRVFWVNRSNEPFERLGTMPEATGRSLFDVVNWVKSSAGPPVRLK